MSHLVKGIFAAAAASLTVGAVQFASGHDLPNPLQAAFSDSLRDSVNRAGKGDRAGVAVAALPSRTISFTPGDLAETSVLVRVLMAPQAVEGTHSSIVIRPASAKPAVACEPVVSVLTEVAKSLQPGRCIT